MILLIDNYDSFVHNLARYIRLLGESTRVVRSDQLTLEEIRQMGPQAIVLSPGPKSPTEAGISLQCIQHFSGWIPIFGVCLGHQAIGSAFGGAIVEGLPMHGRASEIRHDGNGVFADIPCPMTVGRYHSLIIERSTLPDCLEVTAEAGDGTIMGVKHRVDPTYGVQFHPESVLSLYGSKVIENFLQLAKSYSPSPSLGVAAES